MTTSGSQIAAVLAQAYNDAPSEWLRSYPGRITNNVRTKVYLAGNEGLQALYLLPKDAESHAYFYGAEQALLSLLRTAQGTDPRGGKERDQMVAASDHVARMLARLVVSEAQQEVKA